MRKQHRIHNGLKTAIVNLNSNHRPSEEGSGGDEGSEGGGEDMEMDEYDEKELAAAMGTGDVRGEDDAGRDGARHF